MGSASDPPSHPARNLPAGSSYRLNKPPAAVETSIGPPHYSAECTHSHASVQPSLRAHTGHANSDSFSIGPPHYSAECTHSHASVQPSLRAHTGHANSDSFWRGLAYSSTEI